MPRRITIAGEVFSTNLGDGVLGECTAHLAKKADPDACVTHLDLSGQTGFQTTRDTPSETVPTLGLKSRSAGMIPGPIRNRLKIALWNKSHRDRLRTHYLRCLENTDVLIIGGGQILMDNGLYFPMKLALLWECAKESGIETVGWFSCGVGAKWSKAARSLLSDSIEGPNVDFVITRDEQSMIDLTKAFPSIKAPRMLAIDPATWAAECYGVKKDEPERKNVGLGIMNPTLLQSHPGCGMIQPSDVLTFWKRLAGALQNQGETIEIFTNGSADDVVFARKVFEELDDTRNTSLIPQPLTPDELTRKINSFDVVVAHRMHSVITAFACRVPAVSLRWDMKVEAFMNAVNRSDLLLQPEHLTAEDALKMIEAARRKPISEEALETARKPSLAAMRKILH